MIFTFTVSCVIMYLVKIWIFYRFFPVFPGVLMLVIFQKMMN